MGGQDLAVHLMRTDDNEHVDVHELRGFVSDDLNGAFKEAQAISRGTKCRQYLFSLSLNPPETEDVSIEAFIDAVERIVDKLGLEGQPRAIVFHEKEGRRHAHCVWSRIDAETMTAKPMSFFKSRLTAVSRDLYIEHDWKMPQGLADPSKRDPRNFSLAEWQQAKRAGHDPRTFKGAVQDAWAMADTRPAFEHALRERGLVLARGDQRGHVIVDHRGEVYGLARTLGKKTKEVRTRLGDESGLQSVADAKRQIAEEMSPTIRKHVAQARGEWQTLSASLSFKKTAIRDRQRSERATLSDSQRRRQEMESKARSERLPRGVRGLWSRITGNYQRIAADNEQQAKSCADRDLRERETLIFRHLSERRQLQGQIKQHRTQQASLLRDLRADIRGYEKMKVEPRRRRRERTREPR